MRKNIHILIAFAAIFCLLIGCQKRFGYLEEDTTGEILIQVKGDGLDIEVDTKTTAVVSIPSTLYWGATNSGSVKWSTTSVTPSSGVIYTGKYQTATPTSYVYYVANQTFTTGGTMTVANNNTDIVVGKTTSSTTRPSVLLNHIFARTGSLTLNVPAGQTASSVSWQIRGLGIVTGTAGTYTMSSGWSSVSTRLSDWTTITSSSDMYLIPGSYQVKVSFTLTNAGNSETYTEIGEVLLVDGKINNITATTTSETDPPLVGIDFTVSVTPWTSASQSLETHELLYGNHNGHDFVDLGCRKGMYKILFARENVCAYSPIDHGAYFAWGGSTPQYSYDDTTFSGDTFEWYNAPYHESSTPGPYYDWTKYILPSESSYGTPDNRLVLVPTDDASTVIWGGQWRIPTKDELQWLVDNCTWTWQSNYDYSDKSGYLVTGKGDFSSASIFLPTTGFGDNSTLVNVNTIARYWSSSRTDVGHTQALSLSFNSSSVGLNNEYRYCGQAIRPVCRIKDEKATAALPGEFSVSSTKKVQFSRGNLQAIIGYEHAYAAGDLNSGEVYTAKKWQLADNQWDYIGENYTINNYQLTKDEVIDLFGIVTDDAPVNCYGIITSDEYSDYYSSSDNLWTDWGDVPGVIKEIGYGWRLLTKNEANYLFSSRTGAASKYSLGRIGNGTNYVNGLIILPDTWSRPSTCTFTSGIMDFSTNTYRYDYSSGNSNAWCDMENAGAVFLPAAGYNFTYGAAHDEYTSQNDEGFYWTSDKEEGLIGGGVLFWSTINFYDSAPRLMDFIEISSGCSVRLVKEI